VTATKSQLARYVLVALVLITSVWVPAAVATPVARADFECGINYAIDPSSGMCKPIYSRPTGGCDPYTPNQFQSCLGGNWMDIPVTTGEIYSVICNDLNRNGVSVPSVEDIYHMLYEPPYGLSGPEAGRSVALAVRVECPEFRPAMDEAVRQALS